MSQIWCRECKQFVNLAAGKCDICDRIVRGYDLVPTYSSPDTSMKIDHNDTLVTADLVEMLGCATSTITTMVTEGKIPAVKSGGIWVFRKSVLSEWERNGRPCEEEDPELFAKARSWS